jgi:energy-coupling factor transporter ATP-binding protein EcfA2
LRRGISSIGNMVGAYMKNENTNIKAVEVKNYSFRYSNGLDVLKDCSFSLKYGEFTLLSGLSGEGKSTLLSAISGIIPNCIDGQCAGEIFVDGQPIDGLKITDIARKVGYVLQNPDSQIFHSRVSDEIAFGCENLNLPPEEIDRRIRYASGLFDLDPNAATRTLSRGQKQRLMAGCILAMGQKILLLDEPLANLDLEGSRLLLGTLKDLCQMGYAVLLVEHRLDVVIPYADTVLMLENGTVKQANKTALSYERLKKLPSFDAALAPGEPLLAVANLAYNVKGTEILSDINFELRKGERMVVLGDNGSGKTTLLRLIAGLIKPTSGYIDTAIDVKPGSRAWFKWVGYIYQEPSYQLFMPSVKQELDYGARPGWARRCLDAFGLEPIAAQHPHSLSEGQKRRLSIAAVSATAPELLLLDEPTVGQDFEHLRLLVNSLNEIHAQTGNAMITITHDYRCAEALADIVIWIKGGVVFKSGGKELIKEYFADSSQHQHLPSF